MKRKYVIVLLFLMSLIPLLDLFHPGLPITHDGVDHVARIANFYQNLIEGNIVPRWAENLNWGYGHPILMFLYPLPSYVASAFHFLGFSLIDSTKIVFGLAFVLSGLTMYFFVQEALDEEAGFVSAVLYLLAPYRFVDLYVRGAIGEHVAFIFPPLICYFLLKLSKKYSYWYVVGGVLSLAGLILSHNAITLMFLPLIFLYILYLSWISSSKKYFIRNTLYVILLGFGISSFFWVPAFFEGKYTLRDIVTKGGYAMNFVSLRDFLYGPWSYGGSGQFTVQIGIMQWLMVIFILPITVMLRKKKNNAWIITAVLGVTFFITLFFMTSQSKIIWEKITILQKFQFPWRFLSLTVFIAALFGGFFVSAFGAKWKKVIVLAMTCLVFWFSKDYWHANGYLIKPESFFSGIYLGTTDTGESSPIWSVRFMESPPKSRFELIGGDATIREDKRTTTKHIYTIDVKTKIAQIRENTLYFPGWIVMVDNRPVAIEFQSGVNRGVITFFLERGMHTVILLFKETKLRYLSDTISVFSLVILLLWGILNKQDIWRRFRLY